VVALTFIDKEDIDPNNQGYSKGISTQQITNMTNGQNIVANQEPVIEDECDLSLLIEENKSKIENLTC
jgi:hypothetical protein